MNVLSLFDGLGGARIALQNIGIRVDKYYSSEIDKSAINVLKKNYPDSICLGSVENVRTDTIDNIDLLIGGSPCQNLSICGNRKGLSGEQSKLFYEFVRILEETKPIYFLLENVSSMDKRDEETISSILKEDPFYINSSVFTPQNRKRTYWTNIPRFEPIEEKKIYVRDILTDEVNKEKKCSDKSEKLLLINYGGQGDRVYSIYAKGICLSASTGGAGSKTGLYLIDNKGDVTDRLRNLKTKPFIKKFEKENMKWSYEQTLARKLSPIEAERMQGIPDDYTVSVSTSQREKMIGNGFTIPVIEYLLYGMLYQNKIKF